MFPPTMNLSISWYCHLNTQQTAHLSDVAAYKYKDNQTYDVATLKNKMLIPFKPLSQTAVIQCDLRTDRAEKG